MEKNKQTLEEHLEWLLSNSSFKNNRAYGLISSDIKETINNMFFNKDIKITASSLNNKIMSFNLETEGIEYTFSISFENPNSIKCLKTTKKNNLYPDQILNRNVDSYEVLETDIKFAMSGVVVVDEYSARATNSLFNKDQVEVYSESIKHEYNMNGMEIRMEQSMFETFVLNNSIDKLPSHIKDMLITARNGHDDDGNRYILRCVSKRKNINSGELTTYIKGGNEVNIAPFSIKDGGQKMFPYGYNPYEINPEIEPEIHVVSGSGQKK